MTTMNSLSLISRDIHDVVFKIQKKIYIYRFDKHPPHKESNMLLQQNPIQYVT